MEYEQMLFKKVTLAIDPKGEKFQIIGEIRKGKEDRRYIVTNNEAEFYKYTEELIFEEPIKGSVGFGKK
jgi:hypothetical protein